MIVSCKRPITFDSRFKTLDRLVETLLFGRPYQGSYFHEVSVLVTAL